MAVSGAASGQQAAAAAAAAAAVVLGKVASWAWQCPRVRGRRGRVDVEHGVRQQAWPRPLRALVGLTH